jgi:hypothetical protein
MISPGHSSGYGENKRSTPAGLNIEDIKFQPNHL